VNSNNQQMVFNSGGFGNENLQFRWEGGCLRHFKSGKFVHPDGGNATKDDGLLVFYDGGPEKRLELEWSGSCLKSKETGRFIHPSGGLADNDGVALVFHSGGPEARLELEEVPVETPHPTGFHPLSAVPTPTFTFSAIPAVPVRVEESRIYVIKSMSVGGYLDGRNPGMAEPLITYRDPVTDPYLQWYVERVDGGNFALKSLSGGGYLDGRNFINTEPVLSYGNPQGNRNLHWRLENSGDGLFIIKSLSGGGCLAGKNRGDGNLLLSHMQPDASTHWRFIRVEVVKRF